MNLVFSYISPLFNSSASTTENSDRNNTLNNSGLEKKFGNGKFIMNIMPRNRTIDMTNFFTFKFFNLRRLFFFLQILALPCLFSFTKPVTSVSNEQFNTDSAESAVVFSAQETNTEPVNVSWTEVPGVQSYCVVVTENGVPVQHSMVSGTTKTLNGLTTGHTYRCTVVGLANGSQVTDFIIIMDIMP